MDTTARWEQKHPWALSVFLLALVILLAWFFMS
jgi:hypothetical protein